MVIVKIVQVCTWLYAVVIAKCDWRDSCFFGEELQSFVLNHLQALLSPALKHSNEWAVILQKNAEA
jgi:hypothetical protein